MRTRVLLLGPDRGVIRACRARVAAAYSIERLADDFTALYRALERKAWAPSRAG